MRIYFGGGLNEQATPHISEAAYTSFNFELSKDSYRLTPRLPIDLEATVPNALPVTGLMQLVKRDNTETTLVQAGATVYRWNGSSSFTSMGTCATSSRLRDTYWSLDDYLVITDLDKSTPVKTWDGTTFGTLTTGLGATLYAKYGIVHRGRVWLFNVKTSTDTPHLMVASSFENPTSYDTTIRVGSSTFSTGNEAFYMLTPDLKPINGVALFQDLLVISTQDGRLYKLTGSDSRDYAWVDFYVGSSAVSEEAMVNIGNDVIYMRQGGNIDLLKSTQNFGDVSTDDISRWIPRTVKNLTSAIPIYDRVNQKVFFFIANKCLVLFKDILFGGALVDEKGSKQPLSPWSVYKTQDASSFNTQAAKFMRRPGTSTYTVMYGDSAGRILNMNGTGTSGDGGTAAIQTLRKTRLLDKSDGIDFLRHTTRGNVRYRRVADTDLSLEFDWGDEYQQSTVSMTLTGPPASDAAYFGGSIYWGGVTYWGQGFTFADKISHQHFSPVGRGPGVFMTAYTETSLQYQIDHVELL